MNTLNDKIVTGAYGVPVKGFDADIREKGQSQTSLSTLKANSVERVSNVTPALEEKLDDLMLESNAKLMNLSDSLKFEKHEGSGRNVYSLVDFETKTILKQFPSEEFLQVSTDLKEYLENRIAGRNDNSSIGNLISSKT